MVVTWVYTFAKILKAAYSNCEFTAYNLKFLISEYITKQ